MYSVGKIVEVTMAEGKDMDIEQSSQTTYDNVLRTLMHACPKLILAVINEAFGEHFSGKEEVTLKANEIFIRTADDELEKRITDGLVGVSGADATYHFECESNPFDKTMTVRFFEYDSQVALRGRRVKDGVLELPFPKSALIYLRSTRNTPDALRIRLLTPGGEVEWEIPALKVSNYSLDYIFEKRLYFMLPFHIFAHEGEFAKYDEDDAKLAELVEEYKGITERLEAANGSGELDAFEKGTIYLMMKEVLGKIAAKHEKIRKEVNPMMGGEVIMFPEWEMKIKAYDEGKMAGEADGILSQARATAKNLRDMQMDVGTIAKVIGQPVERVEGWLAGTV